MDSNESMQISKKMPIGGLFLGPAGGWPDSAMRQFVSFLGIHEANVFFLGSNMDC